MTRDEAINKAAAWWFKMIKDGTWDNGDPVTEAARAGFMTGVHPPTAEDYAKLEPGLMEMVRQQVDHYEASADRYLPTKARRTSLYADYGYGPLDDLYGRLGLKMSSSFHCPQKAGTVVICDGNGNYTVEAKDGYRGQWRQI